MCNKKKANPLFDVNKSHENLMCKCEGGEGKRSCLPVGHRDNEAITI
jgi:hypothetical protein